jgi:hypothetical protein
MHSFRLSSMKIRKKIGEFTFQIKLFNFYDHIYFGNTFLNTSILHCENESKNTI